jgi:hypothetical protein
MVARETIILFRRSPVTAQLSKSALIRQGRAMTRNDLLQYIEQARAQRRRRSGWLALGVVAFCAIGVWMLSQGQVEGWVPILFFGCGAGTGIAMGFLEPGPTYVGGRLEARLAWGATLIGLVALGATIAGALLFAEAHLQSAKGVIVGLCGMLLAVILILRIASLLRPGPALVVDAEGLYDSRAMRRPVTWDEVVSFDRVEMKSNIFYRIRLRDAAALSLASRMNGMFGIDGATLNCAGLTCGQGDMLLAVHAHRPGLLGYLPLSAAA